MYLFVYGTLLSAIPSSMSKFLRRRGSLIGSATAKGQLFDLGMYPGFQSGGGVVTGELYELDENRVDETIEMLDAYESVTGAAEDEYTRDRITCTLPNGKSYTAETYISKRIPKSAPKIDGGDYASFFTANAAHQRFVNGG